MCNLYRMTRHIDEVAAWFDCENLAPNANFSDEVYPGYPGLVRRDNGLAAMVWGFPLALKGAQGQMLKPKPVNNARSDKLQTNFWRTSFEERRCLIPLTAWAEAQGAKGAKTRSWMAMPDGGLFGAAGVWRESEEWGASYSMVMVDSQGSAVADIHHRMPLILTVPDQEIWLKGEPADAFGLCKPFEGPISIDHTDESWTKRAQAPSKKPQSGEQPSLF